MRDNTGDAQIALTGKADPNAPRDMYDLTPLHYAAHHGNIQMVEALLQKKVPYQSRTSCDKSATVGFKHYVSTFCLFTLSDLGANWDLGSTYVCQHLTQVAPKTDNSILYFFERFSINPILANKFAS